MKRTHIINLVPAVLPTLLAAALGACSERYAAPQLPPGPAGEVPAAAGPADECLRAGGRAKTIKECDGSESLWCDISAREACYADQVAGGRCTAGEYSEELKGVVGITPRVLCDRGQ